MYTRGTGEGNTTFWIEVEVRGRRERGGREREERKRREEKERGNSEE